MHILSVRHSSCLRDFISRHDSLPIFQASYFVAAFLAAVVFNIGFFLLLVLLHVLLDVSKFHAHGFGYFSSIRGALLECLFDFCLLAAALTFTVYFHHPYGLAAVSGIVRSEVALLRAFVVIVPKFRVFEDLTLLSRALGMRLQSPNVPLLPIHRWMLLFLFLCLFSFLYGCGLYAGRFSDLVFVLNRSLTPWQL